MPATTHGAVFGAVFWSTVTGYNIQRAFSAIDTFPTGITFGARAHPLAGSVNLQYLSLDGNSATHRIKVGGFYPDASMNIATGGTRPGWCLRFPFAPGVSGTYTKPTSTAVLVDGSTDNQSPRIKLSLNTSGQLVLTVRKVSAADTLDFTANAAIPDTVDDYQCEIWYSTPDGGFTHQMLVRLVKISDRTHVDYINANMPNGYPHTQGIDPGGVSFYVGENTARGSGFAPQLGPFYVALENAEDPYGLIRVDRMEPNGIGHTDEWPGASADVDESGAGVPDGATTEDTVTYNGGGSPVTKTQLYDLTAPLDVTGSDALTGTLTMSAWAVNPIIGASKGSSQYITGLISDGTNDREAGSSINALGGDGLYKSHQWVYGKDPAGGTLAHGDLAALEAGVIATANSTTDVQFKLSALTVTVPYVKSGETVEPVATAPLPVAFMGQPGRFGLAEPAPTARLRPPFIGLFAAAPPPPVVTTRSQAYIF